MELPELPTALAGGSLAPIFTERQMRSYGAACAAAALEAAAKVAEPMDYGTDDAIAIAIRAIAIGESAPAALSDKQLTAAVLADETLQYHFALNGGAGPVSKKGVKIFRAIERAVRGQA